MQTSVSHRSYRSRCVCALCVCVRLLSRARPTATTNENTFNFILHTFDGKSAAPNFLIKNAPRMEHVVDKINEYY